MTAPRYEIVSKRDESFGIVWQETVLDLPTVPVGTSIRLERTEDGWVDRGVLRRDQDELCLAHDSFKSGAAPICEAKRFDAVDDTPCALVALWVDAPSTETTP